MQMDRYIARQKSTHRDIQVVIRAGGHAGRHAGMRESRQGGRRAGIQIYRNSDNPQRRHSVLSVMPGLSPDPKILVAIALPTHVLADEWMDYAL